MASCPKGFPEGFFRELQPEAQLLTEITFPKLDEDCRQRVLAAIESNNIAYSRVYNFMTAMMQECAEMKRRCDPNFHSPPSNPKKLN